MINLINSDCLEAMRHIPDGSVDFILTDPPYGTTACKWDSVIPFEPMWAEIWRVLKPNGACALFGSEPFSSALRMSQIKWFKEDIIWKKDRASNFANASIRHMKIHEIISIFSKKNHIFNKQMKPRISNRIRQGIKNNNKVWRNARTDGEEVCLSKQYPPHLFSKYNPDFKNPESIIKFNIVNSSSKEKKEGRHPTQKPVALLEYLIKTYTLEGETVLDFTMGSGSTGVACKNLGRNFIGIEKDKKYFDIARGRINATS